MRGVSTRAILLALSLALLGLAFPALAGAAGFDRPDLYRLALYLGLPSTIGLFAWIAGARRPSKAGGQARRIALLGLATFAFAQSSIYLAHRLGWLTFTYGDQAVWGSPLRAVAWALPTALVLGIFGTELGLRVGVFDPLAASGKPRWAFALAVLTGVALTWPALAPGGSPPDRDFALAGLAVAFARETVLMRIYQRAGLWLSGLARGFVAFFEAYAINDWASPFFPAANYTSSEPRFYALKAAFALVAAFLFVGLTRSGERGQPR